VSEARIVQDVNRHATDDSVTDARMAETRQHPGHDRPVDRFDLGRLGERWAERFLRHAGWAILDRNWRDGRREIDLVAIRAGEVAFVEVKTRRPGPQAPCEAVTAAQRRNLRFAAAAWLRHHPGVGRSFRFDVIAISDGPDREPEILHIPAAFEADDS
jgi:putative endonuclease